MSTENLEMTEKIQDTQTEILTPRPDSDEKPLSTETVPQPLSPTLGLDILELKLSSMTPIQEEEITEETEEPRKSASFSAKGSALEFPKDPIVLRNSSSTLDEEQPSEEKKRPPMHFTKTTLLLFLIGLLILIGVVVTILLVVVYKVGKPAETVSSSTVTERTAVVASPTAAPLPTTTATRLDTMFSLLSPNRNSRLTFNGETCYMVLNSAGAERWSTPPNAFNSCQMHLQLDGNLVMYFGNAVIWQAIPTGRPMNRSYLLGVSDLGQAQLRDQVSNEVYWSVPS